MALLTGLQDTQNAPKPRLSRKEAQKKAQRNAQRDFRLRQKARRQEEQKKIAEQVKQIKEDQDRLEAQSRELEKEQQTRQDLEQQVRQLKGEIVQFGLSAKRWEENSTVLQGIVKALQGSVGLLSGESHAICRNDNKSSAGSMTLGPSISQSGPKTQVSPRNFPILSNLNSK
ncbi:hypothetical protein N7471_010339 [Penicillium samsonianum]|uniref:uncharacterized protein n=1 Tax=Penicillium samsonianum TaxID=1882272 RepID=UPI002547862A|nr:uncharacterized protein N7471_010339 [Penicillium samsonianum]KAJ6125846.1 hypothetical protein N7471_010339 [Penicillium samsonianum]